MVGWFSSALIGAFRSSLFHSVICSLGGPLSHGSPVVVLFDRGHPRFWNFYSTIPVDVFRVSRMSRSCSLIDLHWSSSLFQAKFTLERLEDQCKTELRSMTETSDSPVLRHPPFQSTLTTPDTSHSGTK